MTKGEKRIQNRLPDAEKGKARGIKERADFQLEQKREN